MAIDLFDPTTTPEPSPITYAPRPKSMKGLKLGLVDNSKFNSKTLLEMVSRRLADRFNTETVHQVTKISPGHPVSDSAIQEFKTSVDVVLAGIGD
jgi:hypothetical protein